LPAHLRRELERQFNTLFYAEPEFTVLAVAFTDAPSMERTIEAHRSYLLRRNHPVPEV